MKRFWPSTAGRIGAAEIGRAYQWAREVGFDQINIDLIAGMLGETEDKWKYAVEKALELDPDSLTVYQMEVPYNTGIAKEAREHGGVSEVASWAQKRAWVDYAFKQFEAAGYVVSSGYTVVKPERHAGFVYRDSLWHGADWWRRAWPASGISRAFTIRIWINGNSTSASSAGGRVADQPRAAGHAKAAC